MNKGEDLSIAQADMLIDSMIKSSLSLMNNNDNKILDKNKNENFTKKPLKKIS